MATLTGEVLKTMIWTKLKVGGAVLAGGLLAGGLSGDPRRLLGRGEAVTRPVRSAS